MSSSKAELTLPTIMAPVLKTQWKVVGDEKLVLVPSGGTVEPTTPVRSASGFDWVARYGLVSLGAILVLVAAGVWCGGRGPIWTGGELLGYLAAIGVALMTAVVAFANVDPLSQLQLNMPILAAGETVMLEVENVPSWRVDLSVVGLVLAVIGVALMLGGCLVRSSDEQRVSAKSVCLAAGALLIAIGVLCQGGSAGAFFMLVTLAIAVLFFLPRSRVTLRKGTERWKRWNEKRAAAKANAESADASGSSGVVASIGLGCLVALSGASVSHAKETERSPFIAADSILQAWEVSRDEHRLRVTGEMELSGHPGDQFLLLKSPATLTRFEGEGLRLSKTEVPGEGLSYVVSIPIAIDKGDADDANINDGEADGGDAEDEGDDGGDSDSSGDGEQPNAPQTYRASFEYQLEAVDAMKSIPVLTGAASVAKVDVSLDVAGWEIFCDAAVMIEQDKDSDKTSGSVLLGPGKAAIVLKPKARDVASEETRFFVEASNLYRPGPGVVDGRHRFQIRPSQGQVSELNCTVPEGLTVSRVAGPVSAWQFDADLGRLHLQITPSQSAPFSVTVDTQRSLEALPADLTLSPMRVLDAGGEVGLLAIAFGPDAQPEKATPTKMSAVNLGDFDSEIMWQKSDVLHRVFRYGADGGSVQLRVVPVQPDVRVVTQQALSLGDERIVLNVNSLVDITRAGLFQLSFPLPDGLEVETISGDALHHWSETNEDDRRQIVLHLNGKTIGKHSFAIVLSGASPSSQREWSLPRFEIAEADRQTGELVVRPTTGIRLRTVARQNVSEMDPRQATGNRKSGSAGLAFRLLQQDWRLTLGIDQLDPWVTGQVLHQITLREGQTRSTLVGNFKVENASIRELQVVLPIDDEGEIKTLRASGKAVSDLVRVQPNANVWQIQFKRRVLGKVEFRIEYERRGERDDDTELLVPVEFPEIRQLAYYYGVRAGGRLEVDYAELTPGWQRVDWNTIPSSLRMAENHTVPALSLRAVSPDAPLAIRASRHSLADALKLRVAEGTFATILSPTGDQLTAVDMTVEVIQRSSLSVGLPAESELFNVFVNGESVHTIRQGGQTNAWQFYILAGIDDRTAKVRFVYSVPGDGIRRIRLRSPEMNVPLENIRWNVLAPEGFELTDSDGNLELIEQENRSVYDRASYLSKMKGKRQNQAAKAAELLEQANQLLRSGEQKKASWAFNNVANQFALDAASNEDARVQLENLQTQQAIVGLNTRRQRLYMDNYENEAVPAQDEQLRQAAADNPILQQAEMNFRPQQLSELLRGNTIEDNAVLQAIAYRLVQHQRATETAPQAILINLPEEGTMYAFTRTVSVTENEPLELDLQFESRYRVPMWQSGLLGLLLAAIASVIVYARKR
ncbi:MAG: hypothetical protein ACF8CQ_18240 [Rhodopirellula sp. JB044]|uniref:hypothetical protein n=1 Tax=Rhodopirellula sp. JB044 TaxID=3342844 RepID=UPI00370B3CC9